MATHRRGARPSQWPVRELLGTRRSGPSALRDPRLYAAVGGLLACGAAATVAFTASDGGGRGSPDTGGLWALPMPGAAVPDAALPGAQLPGPIVAVPAVPATPGVTPTPPSRGIAASGGTAVAPHPRIGGRHRSLKEITDRIAAERAAERARSSRASTDRVPSPRDEDSSRDEHASRHGKAHRDPNRPAHGKKSPAHEKKSRSHAHGGSKDATAGRHRAGGAHHHGRHRHTHRTDCAHAPEHEHEKGHEDTAAGRIDDHGHPTPVPPGADPATPDPGGAHPGGKHTDVERADLGHDDARHGQHHAGHDDAGHDDAGHDDAGHDDAGHDDAGHSETPSSADRPAMAEVVVSARTEHRRTPTAHPIDPVSILAALDDLQHADRDRS